MQNNEDWQARFLLGLIEAVKVSGLQRSIANLANPVNFGR
jgi:hypothetical protein